MRSWIRRLSVSVAAAGLVFGTVAGAAAPAGATTLDMNQSNNWSGYNVSILGGVQPIKSVSAQWIVPTASAHQRNQDEYSAMWIGIGGGCIDSGCVAADATLIQVGTEQDVSANGTTSYSAWWETIPAPSVTAFSVNPGDQMYASITEGTVPETWNIVLQDRSNGQSFTGLVNSEPMPYSSDYSTGEFILETPVVTSSSGAAIGTMPNLAGPAFDLATVNGANPGLTTSDAIQLVDANGNVEATPSAPDSDTDGFAVCTWASSCSTPSS